MIPETITLTEKEKRMIREGLDMLGEQMATQFDDDGMRYEFTKEDVENIQDKIR